MIPVYLYQVADALKTLIETNQVSLGIEEVYFGDQERIARHPSVCIEPNLQRNDIAGVATPMRLQRTHTVVILLYHSRFVDTQTQRRDCDALAAEIEELVHNNVTLGGLVIHAYVSSVESGYSRKEGIIRAAGITVTAITKSP